MESGIFRQKGHRLTAQRDPVLQILTECSGHVVPNDIYELVHLRLPMVNRSTVYRSLDILEEMGVVRHIHDGDGAERYHRAEDPLHLHLYCHSCGHQIDVADLTVSSPLQATLRAQYGFAADLTHFPIAGLCSTCTQTIPESGSTSEPTKQRSP